MMKELTEIHKQDMKINKNLMESVDKLTNQVAELSEHNKTLEQEVDNLLSHMPKRKAYVWNGEPAERF